MRDAAIQFHKEATMPKKVHPTATVRGDGIPLIIEKKSKLYFQNVSDSVVFIFKTLLGIDATPKKLFRRRLTSLPNDIIIKLDFAADLTGHFAFFLSLKTAFEICNRLVPGIGYQYFDKDHLDVIGEMGNMISGNAIGRLQNIDSAIDLSIPSMTAFHTILESESRYWSFSGNFDVDIGQVGILLAIRKDK